MSKPKQQSSKRPRGSYSRFICLGCRVRRIRCELPSEVGIPEPRELWTVERPCYRCKRLGIPCVVRQTILGRPSPKKNLPTEVESQPVGSGYIVSRTCIEIPPCKVGSAQPGSVHDTAQVMNNSLIPQAKLYFSQRDPSRWDGGTLLIHIPQSAETVFTIRAVDTLRYEKVEGEWFRHLPAHLGHSRALDLSIGAIVAACAYTRGVPQVTSGDCYQALAVAINAVQASIKESPGQLNDVILASTALLAPFEGVLKKHGFPARLHVEGLAAILLARPKNHPVTQLAREIFDFHACDSSIMACILGIPSSFESVPRAYFANDRTEYKNSDRAQLKAIGSELFIRIPRLVTLIRSLRSQTFPQTQLLSDALILSESLIELQDPQAEERLLRKIKVHLSNDPEATSPAHRSLQFAAVEDYEALSYYWQNRLSLLRLEQRLHNLLMPDDMSLDSTNKSEVSFQPDFWSRTDETFQLMRKILMCSAYAITLPLHKHARLLVHATVLVWGVRMDLLVACNHIQEEKEIGLSFELLLQRVNSVLKAKPELTIEDMNTAAEIFVGGPQTGRFSEILGFKGKLSKHGSSKK